MADLKRARGEIGDDKAAAGHRLHSTEIPPARYSTTALAEEL
jgi:hypothetical protein